jgi:dihydrofolate reductase
MRTVTYGAACSLDGYIARPDGGVDWLRWSGEVARITGEYWKTVDAVLMGRKTWEAAQAMGAGNDGSGGAGIRTYVFSRTLREAPAGVELVSEDAGAFVRRLKEREGRGICLMGGGELARSLFEAGVIDEVGVNLHPVLLGSGIPLFQPLTRQVDLELVETRPLPAGCTYLIYRVAHQMQS